MADRSRHERVAHSSWVTRIALWSFASTCAVAACGGVANKESAPPASRAGAGNVDSGIDAAEAVDAASSPDAADAGTTAPSPTANQICYNTWTGERSQPQCAQSTCGCAGAGDGPRVIQPVESECEPKPEVCRVPAPSDLDGQACSLEVPSCRFGYGGCSSCECFCLEGMRRWQCQCTAC